MEGKQYVVTNWDDSHEIVTVNEVTMFDVTYVHVDGTMFKVPKEWFENCAQILQ